MATNTKITEGHRAHKEGKLIVRRNKDARKDAVKADAEGRSVHSVIKKLKK